MLYLYNTHMLYLYNTHMLYLYLYNTQQTIQDSRLERALIFALAVALALGLAQLASCAALALALVLAYVASCAAVALALVLAFAAAALRPLADWSICDVIICTVARSAFRDWVWRWDWLEWLGTGRSGRIGSEHMYAHVQSINRVHQIGSGLLMHAHIRSINRVHQIGSGLLKATLGESLTHSKRIVVCHEVNVCHVRCRELRT
jgi:hypothetical protein